MRVHATIPMLLIVAAACADGPTTVAPPPALGPSHSLANFGVMTMALQPESGDWSAWGQVTIMVGRLAPPNPCGELLTGANVIVCGVIHNPDGEPLTGGTLSFVVDSRVVELDFTVPLNPCRTYRIQAAAAPGLGTGGVALPAVQLQFSSAVGTLVGGTPGPPNVERDGGSSAGALEAPPNPCLVLFEAQVRSG